MCQSVCHKQSALQPCPCRVCNALLSATTGLHSSHEMCDHHNSKGKTHSQQRHHIPTQLVGWHAAVREGQHQAHTRKPCVPDKTKYGCGNRPSNMPTAQQQRLRRGLLHTAKHCSILDKGKCKLESTRTPQGRAAEQQQGAWLQTNVGALQWCRSTSALRKGFVAAGQKTGRVGERVGCTCLAFAGEAPAQL